MGSFAVRIATSIATTAVDAAVAKSASQSVVDGLQATATTAQSAFNALDAVFGAAQALGIRWGSGALFIVLFLGAITIFRARATYDDDSLAVIAGVEAAQA